MFLYLIQERYQVGRAYTPILPKRCERVRKMLGERSPLEQPARGLAAQRRVVLRQEQAGVYFSRILLLAVGCFLLAAQCRADGHEAVGCGEGSRTAAQCPRVVGDIPSNILQGTLSSDLPPQVTPCRGTEQICYQDSVTTTLVCSAGTDLRGRVEDTQSNTRNALMEIKPGRGTVCGHGNREFSFFIQITTTVHQKALVVFLNGGTCWDSSCRTRMSLNSDNMVIPNTGDPFKEPSPASPTWFKSLIGDKLSQGIFQNLDDWAIWIIPDCTGDDHIGNRSITYDVGEDSCFTAHHKGGVNTGVAIDYLLDNINGLEQVVLLGTGNNPGDDYNKGMGGVGAAFWAKYIQDRLPSARVRTILDSAMGIYGPDWKTIQQDDPWGAKNTWVPDAMIRGRHYHSRLLPPEDEWSLSEDDMTAYYRWATDVSPSLAFADVSSTNDPVQIDGFVRTGGQAQDCCLEGCGCAGTPLYGFRNGRLDWTKTRKVQVLQRMKAMPNNYRAWLRSGPRRFLLSTQWRESNNAVALQNERLSFCPRLPVESTVCPPDYQLREWFTRFYLGTVVRDGTGAVIGNTFRDREYEDRAFGLSICENCLHGIPGGRGEMEESCNATFYSGENLFTVAAKYHTDWMALWSLNGDASPDALGTGTSYRFAHEYIVQQGDTLESIAARFGTTVEALVELNYNIITHINNPFRLHHGDRICLVPNFATHKDRMGNPVCSPSDPRVQAAGGTI